MEGNKTKISTGFSRRSDGSMYLAPDGFSVENLKNRKRFFATKRLLDENIVAAGLEHGTNVALVDRFSQGFLRATDALVTKETGVVLTVTGADCFPVYFQDGVIGVIGIAHAGWRGIVAGIVPKTIAAMIEVGARIENISMTIGPGICKDHFEIQEKDRAAFSEFPQAMKDRDDGRIMVHLKKIIRIQAKHAGIARKRMTDRKECTVCLSDKYFSWRRDKPEVPETQVAFIVRKEIINH